MNASLRQKLLELHYELLTEAEAAELRRRIAEEPEVARLYAEIQQTATLFAQAAKITQPRIVLPRKESIIMANSSPSNASTPSSKPISPKRRLASRRANWLVGVAAVLLVLVSIGGYIYHHIQKTAIASEHLRLVVAGPSTIQYGVAAPYDIQTTGVTGSPLTADIKFDLYSPDGKRIQSYKDSTDEQGRLQMVVPADMSLPPRATIKVVAYHRENQEEFSATVDVEPPRFVTRLALDKPLYQPGETVFYRSLTLSRFALAVDREFPIEFAILDPSGAIVANSQLQGITEQGVGNGVFTLPAELPGGQYTLLAQSIDGSFPKEEQKFFVRAYRLPRLKKELEFARDSYAPGETVKADFSAQRAEGGPAADAKLKILATVDGQNVFNKSVTAAADGTFAIEFPLPEKIDEGAGQLAVIADDGGTQETIAKTIPINLGKVVVNFYPEGGDMVAGLENRVYFTSRNPLGEPVHIEGKVVDDRGRPVALVETLYEGQGSFHFTPERGTSYKLEITKPEDATEQPALPAVSTTMPIVLSTGTGVFGPDAPLEFNIRSRRAGLPLVVGAWCRGVLVGQQTLVTVEGENGMNPVVLRLPEGVGGVIRLTVFDYSVPANANAISKGDSPFFTSQKLRQSLKSALPKGDSPIFADHADHAAHGALVPEKLGQSPKPLAERLVYRRLDRKLNVRTADRRQRYSPGEDVKLSLVVTDEKGEAVPAALGVAVVDDTLLNLADDHTPNITTYFLLSTEIEKPEDLEEADFYLSDEKKQGVSAATALDLLLGTQGWRRFAEKTWQQLEEETPEKDRLARLVALSGPAGPPTLFDNFSKIQAAYEKSLEAYQTQQTRWMGTLTTVCFLAGMGLLLIVIMLGILRAVSGAGFWLPALGATTCCVIIGLILVAPGQMAFDKFRTVAFLPYQPPEPEKESASQSGAMHGGFGGMGAMNGKGFMNQIYWRWPVRGQEMHEQILVRDGAKRFPVRNALGVNEPAAGQRRRFNMGENLEIARRQIIGLEVVKGEQGEKGRAGKKFANLGKFLGRRKGLAAGYFGTYCFGAAREDSTWPELQQYRFPVRQYAHEHKPSQPGVRSDFAETLYWNPLLIADADGKVEIKFALSDAVTAFRLRADAHGSGRIGSGQSEILSRIPFNLEPKLPLEVNAGDRIDLPLAVVNDSPGELDVGLKLEHDEQVRLGGSAERKLELAAGARRREFFGLDVTGQKGQCALTFRGTAGALADAVTRKLKIVPPGFPKNTSYSGQIDGPQEVVVRLPDQWVPGSLEVSVNAFPSMLANLQQGLDGILREPNGCFEQASTSNYPNVMTMQYLEENELAAPQLTRRARNLMKSGYAKLAGYECKKKGYEWFGGDPGHEALTAYGLMQFRDMNQVYDVDDEMLRRTAKWLMARRDGRGGFQRNPKALDSFGSALPEVTDAYITWALSESGQEGIDAEVTHCIELAEKTDDPYVVALTAAAALNAGKQDAGRKLLQELASQQADDGHLDGKLGSITRSGGASLKMETTALAALAWLKMPAFSVQANKAVGWIIENRRHGGGFGSTQATILALKALTQHAKANKRPITAGKLIVQCEGKTLGQCDFQNDQQETISIDELEAQLKSGDNKVTLSLTSKNEMPYTVDVSYRTLQPESDEKCPVRLKTRLAQAEVRSGETVALTAELTNATDQGQPMTVAILGLPAGLEPRPDQLEELKKAGTIDFYETRAREIICYWRCLAPKKSMTLKLDLVAAVPGRYTGPASRAYLYYTPEQKQWCDPLKVSIAKE